MTPNTILIDKILQLPNFLIQQRLITRFRYLVERVLVLDGLKRQSIKLMDKPSNSSTNLASKANFSSTLIILQRQ